MSKKYIGVASLLLVAFFYSVSGVIAKYLSDTISPYQTVFLRFFVAFAFGVVLYLFSKQRLTLNKYPKFHLIFFCLCFPLSAILFTLSIYNTSVSEAVFAFYVSTVGTSFITGYLIFKEKITFNKLISLLLLFFAVLLVTGLLNNFEITLNKGLIFGLLSGVMQTLTSIFQKKLSAVSDNLLNLVLIQTFSGALLAALIVIHLGQPLLISLTTSQILICLLFGLIFLIIAYLFLIGFRYTPLNSGSVIVSSDLIFTPVIAYIFLKEVPHGYTLFGACIVLLAVYLANKSSKV